MSDPARMVPATFPAAKNAGKKAVAKAKTQMAQLSDDCFAFGGPMMSVDDAVGIIAARVTPVRGLEKKALAGADGRVLAGGVRAPLPLPPFTNSAVDGYAVASRDLHQAGAQAFSVT